LPIPDPSVNVPGACAVTPCCFWRAAAPPKRVGEPPFEPPPEPPDERAELIAQLLADDPEPNPGWIGGACDDASDCAYADALCLTEAEGFPGGSCSLGCEQLCPDQEGEANTVTFCLEGTSGTCVSRCDFELLTNGCRDGWICEPGWRESDPTVVRSVCMPAEPDDVLPVECYADLLLAGAELLPWNVEAAQLEGQVCWVEAPTALVSPVGGVGWKPYGEIAAAPLYVNCDLAKHLLQLSAILDELGIIEVTHIGTYNCRVIAGTTTLSEHAFANAIDLHEFVAADGTVYNVEQHWEYDTDAPVTPEGRFLYDLAQRLYDEWVFNVILTPSYNEAHYNHFHVDLSEGSRFLRGPPPHYIGPNQGH
jgi:hypothetical protein